MKGIRGRASEVICWWPGSGVGGCTKLRLPSRLALATDFRWNKERECWVWKKHWEALTWTSWVCGTCGVHKWKQLGRKQKRGPTIPEPTGAGEQGIYLQTQAHSPVSQKNGVFMDHCHLQTAPTPSEMMSCTEWHHGSHGWCFSNSNHSSVPEINRALLSHNYSDWSSFPAPRSHLLRRRKVQGSKPTFRLLTCS